ncbi:hypothetical protein HM1_1197 [Heliomicrobium modesticaldum Ice1]|uniref:Uncharacterized protein n=1 Tax=Heliobacterium modesticaldum (strain ATCC 51547 / Ice1) TaxID=498761 RepID=B0TH52_HELMI|nr:hypothetical protein HM1_1197 [Heliomicrobium modesticaldum Ice1]
MQGMALCRKSFAPLQGMALCRKSFAPLQGMALCRKSYVSLHRVSFLFTLQKDLPLFGTRWRPFLPSVAVCAGRFSFREKRRDLNIDNELNF